MGRLLLSSRTEIARGARAKKLLIWPSSQKSQPALQLSQLSSDYKGETLQLLSHLRNEPAAFGDKFSQPDQLAGVKEGTGQLVSR